MLTIIFFSLLFVIHSTQMIFCVASPALSQDKGDAKTDDIRNYKQSKMFPQEQSQKMLQDEAITLTMKEMHF